MTPFERAVIAALEIILRYIATKVASNSPLQQDCHQWRADHHQYRSHNRGLGVTP